MRSLSLCAGWLQRLLESLSNNSNIWIVSALASVDYIFTWELVIFSCSFVYWVILNCILDILSIYYIMKLQVLLKSSVECWLFNRQITCLDSDCKLCLYFFGQLVSLSVLFSNFLRCCFLLYHTCASQGLVSKLCSNLCHRSLFNTFIMQLWYKMPKWNFLPSNLSIIRML